MLKKTTIVLVTLTALNAYATPLPKGFVYLREVDPSILQEIRYAGYHNFIGRPIKGYEAGVCILTQKAALALRQVQRELSHSGLSIKVYDCYRPQRAVNDFISWSKIPGLQEMKAEFYPNTSKADFFKLGYVAEKSSHTRGSTVDLTLVSIPTRKQADYHRGQALTACFKPYNTRFKDNSIDMGTGYDCFDSLAHGDNRAVNLVAYQHRQLLRILMEKYHFASYPQEWWHFTLRDEPYPDTYFNFPVKE